MFFVSNETNKNGARGRAPEVTGSAAGKLFGDPERSNVQLQFSPVTNGEKYVRASKIGQKV